MDPDKVKQQNSPELYPVQFLVQQAEQSSSASSEIQNQPAPTTIESSNPADRETAKIQAEIIRTTQETREIYRRIIEANNRDVLSKLRKAA